MPSTSITCAPDDLHDVLARLGHRYRSLSSCSVEFSNTVSGVVVVVTTPPGEVLPPDEPSPLHALVAELSDDAARQRARGDALARELALAREAYEEQIAALKEAHEAHMLAEHAAAEATLAASFDAAAEAIERAERAEAALAEVNAEVPEGGA